MTTTTRDGLGDAIKGAEVYAGRTLRTGTWTVVRADGRAFHTLAANLGLTRPYDERFRDWMLTAARTLLTELNAVCAYTQSDEISVLLGPEFGMFGRRHEKLVSIAAATATSAFSAQSGSAGMFDARAVELPTEEWVTDYFQWRQIDAYRNAINSWVYWTMRDREGMSVRAATSACANLATPAKIAWLANHGITWADTPTWQTRGLWLTWEEYPKTGVDPRTGATVEAVRRRVRTSTDAPSGWSGA